LLRLFEIHPVNKADFFDFPVFCQQLCHPLTDKAARPNYSDFHPA
jgi:hypothetical protein